VLWSSRPINTKAFDYYPSLRKVREHFEISYAEPLSLAAAAAIASLEAKHFSKVFRKKVGIGFKEWMDVVRIGKAMDAIQAEYQSLSDIAFAVRFQDLRTFQRAFKQHAHMRPREYRREIMIHLDNPQVV